VGRTLARSVPNFGRNAGFFFTSTNFVCSAGFFLTSTNFVCNAGFFLTSTNFVCNAGFCTGPPKSVPNLVGRLKSAAG
jgi:hypothetical protein